MLPGDILRGVALSLAEQTALRASTVLSAAGIEHVVVKGLAVALTLRPERMFRDVDLIVSWRDFWPAQRLLREAGFRASPTQTTLHSAALGSPLRASPDLDLQGWLGYPLLPLGGLGALMRDARWVPAGKGSLPIPSTLDLGCLSALYAVRDRLRPETSALLDDLRRAVALHGQDVVEARARELGLARHVAMALDPIYHPWSIRLRDLDARYPRAMTALPAVLVGGWRGLVSVLIASVVAVLEHAARRLQKP